MNSEEWINHEPKWKTQRQCQQTPPISTLQCFITTPIISKRRRQSIIRKMTHEDARKNNPEGRVQEITAIATNCDKKDIKCMNPQKLKNYFFYVYSGCSGQHLTSAIFLMNRLIGSNRQQQELLGCCVTSTSKLGLFIHKIAQTKTQISIASSVAACLHSNATPTSQ